MIFTLHLIKKCIELFKNDGAIPLPNEPQQAHDQDLFDLQNASMMMYQKKRATLVYPTFLRQKQCGRIKMQGYDDSHKPQSYLSREETCSSTIATASLFPSCAINMKDGKDASTNHVNDKAHIRVAGKRAKLIMKMDKEVKHAKDTIWHTPDHTSVCPILLPIAHFQHSTLSTTMWHMGNLKMLHMSCDIIIEIGLLMGLLDRHPPLMVNWGKMYDYNYKHLDLTFDQSMAEKVPVCIKMVD